MLAEQDRLERQLVAKLAAMLDTASLNAQERELRADHGLVSVFDTINPLGDLCIAVDVLSVTA